MIKKSIQKIIGFYFNLLAYINSKKLQKVGFELFCNPMSKKLKPYQIAFLQTGKSKILKVDDYKIQTYKWGNGSKSILLVHGWASHSFRWKKHIEHLQNNDFTVYAIDAPAHGLSSGKIMHLVIYAKVLNEFLKHNQSITAIISHSIGGFATTYMLFKYPQLNINKAVIMAAPSDADDFFKFYMKALGLTQNTTNLIMNEFEKRLGNKPSYFKSYDFAKNIDVEALIIHDKNDEATDYNKSILLHQNWKNSKLQITEGLGHNLKSKALLKNVTDFLTQ